MPGFRQELVGLFGRPVDENPTQAMIEAGFAAAGLDWRYLTIEVAPDDLRDAVRGARAMGLRGFNCTIPHKVAVVEHLDRLGRSAELMGAVNCVVRRGDELVGENTDGAGFLEALRRRRDPAGSRVVMLGAGGAARAIAVELLLADAASLTVVNRSAERGRELGALLAGVESPTEVSVEALGAGFQVPPDADVVVNATSIGLYPDLDAVVPLGLEEVAGRALVADVIPNPPETRFLRAAAELGCETLDGLEMLVEQGRIGFELWTGVEPDVGAMRDALRRAFELA
ncbi:MAG TPA: shikimate dehydrogenase [Gaiellaceae bacterium]|jgi:shikimate dehydrogenase|nr:shikimate dehydrogenase [Gaiellaceae bacterium]